MSASNSQPSEYVTLVSEDGFEFVISREAACVSEHFAEARTGRCVLENISPIVLQKVCEYLLYSQKHKTSFNVADMDIPPEMCLELLMAADYLDA